MNKTKLMMWACVPALLVTMTACSSAENGNREVIKEPGKTITVIEDAGKEAGDPDVSIGQIDPYENMEISDWLDEETVIVTKENTSLDKMKLEELSGSYPRSLYTYNLKTKEYTLLKEKENVFMGSASLSPDKKHLLYSEYTLGDPVFYVMNLETKDSFAISGNDIGGAMSAKWTSDNSVIGAAYSGGAYTASPSGEIAAMPELTEDALFIVTEQSKDKIYYNTNDDNTLMVLDLATKEKASTNLETVYHAAPSPDGNQLAVLQANGSKSALVLSNADGSNPKAIAEGTELGGVSWSPDQRLIAYTKKADGNGTTANALYVYDLLTGKSKELANNIENAGTLWSPSGQALVYTEWNGEQTTSSIIQLTYSLQD